MPLVLAGRAVWRLRRTDTRRAFRQALKAQEETEDQNPITSAIAFISGVIGSLLSSPKTEEGEASIVQQLGRTPLEAQKGLPIYSLGPFPRCTEASDLRSKPRKITVITTAALPWTTGPAINPLLRSLALARRGHEVILVMPWLEPLQQAFIYPEDERFETVEEQERFVRRWCSERAKMAEKNLTFRWYEAMYVQTVKSIFPKQDPSKVLEDCEKDVLVLEEPEHLCWYHEGQRWTDLYKHVIGVVHTNYQVYLEELGYAGIMSSPTIRQSLFSTFTSMVCSAYCDVTIKLSSAGISLPNEVQYNVHGVRQEFFDMAKRSSVGKKRWLPFQETNESTGSLVYFIGKAVKPKGWVQLLNLLETLPDTEVRSGRFRVDAFGSGPEEEEIAEMVQQLNQKREGILQMFPGRNHADKHFEQYKVLVNASTTEMLCTVTAEALAMGKHVVLAEDPSNAYFKANFPERCHFFNLQDPSSFHRALQDALEKEGPLPLSSAAEALLSWDAALERFYDASQVHVLSGRLERPSEARGAKIAFEIHSRFQTDTPAFSKLLKSATLNQEMEFKAPWAELGTTSELMEKLRGYMSLEQKRDFDVVASSDRVEDTVK